VKVAVVSESFLPHVNGVTGSVLQVLRHLRRTGHEALVIAAGDPPRTCEGFEVVALPSVGFPGYPQVRVPVVVAGRLVRELARFAPDVIHLASPFVLGGPVVRAAASLDIPVVAIYQTDVAGFALRYGLTAASNAAWRRIRSIHERAHITLAPSPTAARDLELHGVPRVRVWPRGVDTSAFSPAHRSARLRAQLAPWATCPGVRLVIIGEGPERERLGRRLAGAHFTGLLSGADLSRAWMSLSTPAPMKRSARPRRRLWPAGSPWSRSGQEGCSTW
jgi:phosphatidylinositol alpha 1,6-mannosyltransferase